MSKIKEKIANSPLQREHIDNLSARQMEQNVLALDALSKLTRQFADKPDFQELLRIILFTFSGQFGVGSCFITVKDPGAQSDKLSYLGIGKFKDNITFKLFAAPENETDFVFKSTRSYRIAELGSITKNPLVAEILEVSKLSVIVPLIHGDKLIGLIGLGEKLKSSEYSDGELELMTSIGYAITPLLINAFLFRDISDLSKWYYEIINSVKQGVFVFDSSSRLSGINQAGTDLLKTLKKDAFDPKDITRKKIDQVFEEDFFSDLSQRILHIKGNPGGVLLENVVVGKDDTKHIFNVRVSDIKEYGHEDKSIVVTLDDITEQKDSEQKMFDLERLADKGLMASSISHELNNFLGMVLAGTEMAQAALEKSQIESAGTFLEKVKVNISKMVRFTAGLMDYSRLDTNKRDTNINDIVNDVMSFVAVQKRFKHYSVKSRLEGNLPNSQADPDQIAQLLINMLNNAADAMSEAKRTSGQIEIVTKSTPQEIILSIKDSGAGMTDEVKEKLFNKQITTKEKGHGYGLITCGKIVKNHGGTIKIDSKLGSGTTFEIHLAKK